jgi:hypothetical protein
MVGNVVLGYPKPTNSYSRGNPKVIVRMLHEKNIYTRNTLLFPLLLWSECVTLKFMMNPNPNCDDVK